MANEPSKDSNYETVGSMLGDLDLTQASKSLSPVGQLGSGLEYIFTDDLPYVSSSGGFVPSRSFSDDLCYGTGTVYISGLMFGGSWGLFQGMKAPLAIPSARLRINAILNAISRRGPFVGNSVGILAMFYNGINSGIGAQYGKENEALNSVIAGTISGILFKSTGILKTLSISR
jgi:import inner membrane translocase subunit TIM23